MKQVEAITNTIQEHNKPLSTNPKILYLGTGCPYPENHTVIAVPHPENGFLLTRTSVQKVRAVLDEHERRIRKHEQKQKEQENR